MRYRGLVVLVLATGVVLASSAMAIAQTTQPAGTDAPVMKPVPTENSTAAPAPAGESSKTPAAGEKKPVTTQPGNTENKGPDTTIFFVLLAGVVLMWIWMGRGRRKQESKHKQMLAELKKGDKIVTIGGIIGTVIEVRNDEITVKVDETNNVRMKFTRRAISGVGEAAKTAEDDKK